MNIAIATRIPSDKELQDVDMALTEIKRMIANLNHLKIANKKADNLEIESVKAYLKENFNFIIDYKF